MRFHGTVRPVRSGLTEGIALSNDQNESPVSLPGLCCCLLRKQNSELLFVSKILLKRLQKSKGADVPKSARRGRAGKDKGR